MLPRFPLHQEAKLVLRLFEAGQEHLFANWPAPGTKDNKKKAFLQQLLQLDRSAGPSPPLLPRGMTLMSLSTPPPPPPPEEPSPPPSSRILTSLAAAGPRPLLGGSC